MHANKKSRSHLWLMILTLLIAAIAFVGVAFGKYIQTSQFTETLQFNAKLADSFQLLEHEALRQPDGSYVLDATATETTNEYILIPGLDIPKDPHVVITNKTSIEAYLYVEVVDKTDNGAIVWSMADHWLLLDGLQGKKDKGAVYVYAPGGKPTPLTRQEGDRVIYLIKDNTVYVNQGLLGAKTADILTFYAAMGEVNAEKEGTAVENAKEIYKNHVKIP